MQEIQRINHFGLRVSDLATARAFYEKLGFEFIVGPVGPEPVAIMEHPSGVNVNFILNANQREKENVLMHPTDKRTGYTHVALEVTNTEVVLDHLAKAEIRLSGGPVKLGAGTSTFIRDPGDNVIEFFEVAT